MKIGPLVQNFKATTITKAFFLNSIATGAIAMIAVETRMQLDRHTDYSERNKVIINLVTTVVSALLTYWLMYLIFNFGGGMLTNGKLV